MKRQLKNGSGLKSAIGIEHLSVQDAITTTTTGRKPDQSAGMLRSPMIIHAGRSRASSAENAQLDRFDA
jgi:hypothetical protein